MARKKKSKSKKGLIIGIISGVVVLGTVAAIMISQKKSKPETSSTEENPESPAIIPQEVPEVPEAIQYDKTQVTLGPEIPLSFGLQPLSAGEYSNAVTRI